MLHDAAAAGAHHPVVTDITVCTSPTHPSSWCDLDQRKWYLIDKDLYLYTSSVKRAWLHVQLTAEKDLESEELVVVNIEVGAAPLNRPGSDSIWESRPGGLWILRNKFSGTIDEAITGVDVLFGADAVDPRPQWTLMDAALRFGAQPEVPAARLTVLRGRAKPRSDDETILRVKKDRFKIVQISDMHMGTGAGVCKDAIDADGNFLPEGVADPLTINFVENVLDHEKPDFVAVTGDQLHHDIPDSQTALFKAVAPMIQRSIPFAVVFGNHDSEGAHALSREAQMSILHTLPFSLCESGPKEVDGIGNFYLQILAPAPSQIPLSTLFFLDSHGQIPSNTTSPDYSPITKSQIDWFSKTSKALRSTRESKSEHDLYSCLVFLHIPLPEFGDRDLRIYSGSRREPTEGPSHNSHFYDALVKEDILAIGVGHDHVNNFCALLPNQTSPEHRRVNGPWLCYGGGSGFHGYCSYRGERFHRQARVWEMNTETGTWHTWSRVQHHSDRVGELSLTKGEHADGYA